MNVFSDVLAKSSLFSKPILKKRLTERLSHQQSEVDEFKNSSNFVLYSPEYRKRMVENVKATWRELQKLK